MSTVRVPRNISQEIEPMSIERSRGGRPTERWQDKSREVRRGRLAGKRAMINGLARCAMTRDSLPTPASHCECSHKHTSLFGRQ